MISKENLYAIIDVLKTKKNIILQGAPGTGKTYSTIEIALNICGVNTLSLSREDMIKIYNDLSQKGQIAFSTFHQTMDYDDFIEGLKPQLENGHTILRMAYLRKFAKMQVSKATQILMNVTISYWLKFRILIFTL